MCSKPGLQLNITLLNNISKFIFHLSYVIDRVSLFKRLQFGLQLICNSQKKAEFATVVSMQNFYITDEYDSKFFDELSVEQLLKSARLESLKTYTADRPMKMIIEINGVEITAPMEPQNGALPAAFAFAVLGKVIALKTARITFYAKTNTYAVYDTNELIIHNLQTHQSYFHKCVYEYSLQYQRRHASFGEIKPVVEALDQPYYENWLLEKFLKKT